MMKGRFEMPDTTAILTHPDGLTADQQNSSQIGCATSRDTGRDHSRDDGCGGALTENGEFYGSQAGDPDPSTGSGRTESALVSRYLARAWLHDNTTVDTVARCGRVPVRRAGTVDLRLGGRLNQTAHYAGLHTCKRKWLDPVCADASAKQSRREISVLIEKAWKIGTVVFGTKTVAHWPGDPLAVLWDGLAVARRAVNDDKTVRRLRAEYGYYGYVWTWETTIGPNGWHPHEHMLMLFAKRLSKAQIEELHAAEFRAWKAGAKRAGLRAPSERAQDLQRVAGKAEASEYISKSHVQFEMAAGTATKKARGESRNHWELLIDCMRHGEDRKSVV